MEARGASQCSVLDKASEQSQGLYVKFRCSELLLQTGLEKMTLSFSFWDINSEPNLEKSMSGHQNKE